MNYPSVIDSFVAKNDNSNDVMAVDINELQVAIVSLENKVGISGSAVTTSLDYLIKLAADPGHTHTVYELLANKSLNVTTDGASDTKYPSVKSVKTYVDTMVAGLLDYRGAYDASGNTYPASGGSGAAGAVMKGDLWIVSVAGTLGGKTIHIGDYIIAIIDTPGQTDANWDTLDTNLGYTPENIANKVTAISVSSTDTQYPTAKLVYDQLALKVAKDGSATTGNLMQFDASGNAHDYGWSPALFAPVRTIKSGTFASGSTTYVMTDASVDVNTIVDVYAQATPIGGWSVSSGSGSFTITSTKTETSNVAFKYILNK